MTAQAKNKTQYIQMDADIINNAEYFTVIDMTNGHRQSQRERTEHATAQAAHDHAKGIARVLCYAVNKAGRDAHVNLETLLLLAAGQTI